MKNSFISSFEDSQKYRLTKKQVFLFLLLFIVILAGMEKINRVFVTRQSENFSIIYSFEKKKTSVQVLFLGDSHFEQGINTAVVGDNTVNLSPPGASYIQSYYLLKTYLPEMPELKEVVIPLDLHSFSSFRSNRIAEPYFWNRYMDYSELAQIKGAWVWLKKLEFLTVLDESFGREYFVDNILQWIMKRNNIVMVEPRAPDPMPDSAGREDYQRVEFQFKNQVIFDKDLLLYFGKILQLCQEHNIKVVTLQVPASAEYIKYSSKYITKEQLQQKILGDPVYRNAIYKNIDCVELYLDHDDYFEPDGDHLNYQGSLAFSKYLASQPFLEK